MLSTICTGITGTVGLMMVYQTSKPFNTIHKIMMVGITVTFVACYFLIPGFFTLAALNGSSFLILSVFALLAWPVLMLFNRINDKLKTSIDDSRYKRGKHMK